MLRAFLVVSVGAVVGCGSAMSDAEVRAVRTEVEAALVSAYDFAKADVPRSMLSLYPATGRVVSASAGRITTSRDSLEGGIRWFWQNVGVNMQEPRWIWDTMYVEVISPATAVVTASYHVPHKTPRGEDHVIAGAMTALFEKRDGKWVIIQEHLSDVPASPNEPSMEPMPATPNRSTRKP